MRLLREHDFRTRARRGEGLPARLRALAGAARARPLAEWPRPLIVAMLFAAEFLSGMGVMILDINAGSIMFALAPDRLRSRAMGAFNFVNWGIRPIGSLVGGAVGAWIGVRTTLWVASVGAIAGALWLLPSDVPGIRELPEEAA